MSRIMPSRRTLVAAMTGPVAGVLPGYVSARINAYYLGPVSDHFDGTRFFNPGRPDEDRGLLDVLQWQLGSRAIPWPNSLASWLWGRQSRPKEDPPTASNDLGVFTQPRWEAAVT